VCLAEERGPGTLDARIWALVKASVALGLLVDGRLGALQFTLRTVQEYLQQSLPSFPLKDYNTI
jgi:hypothetical protein